MLTPALSTALTIAIPTFAILLGVIFNRQDANALRAEMGQLRVDINRDMTQLRKDVSGDVAQLRKEMVADNAQMRKDVSADFDKFRRDMVGEMSMLRDGTHRDMIGLHERVATVEARQDPQAA